MKLLASSLCALALGTACAACGDDRTAPIDNPDPDPDPDPDPVPPVDPTRTFKLRIENIAPWQFLKVSSQRTRTTRIEGNLNPGDIYETRFTAAPGHQLSFAMSLREANDWFIAPAPEGLPLYTNGTPLSGDITNLFDVWDMGSEYDQEPSVGDATGTRQTVRDFGEPDPTNLVRRVPLTTTLGNGTQFTRPALASMVRITLTPGADSYFTLRVQNISTATTLTTSTGTRNVSFSPFVWALHRGENAFFDEDAPRRANDLERLAESGDVDSIINIIRYQRGVATPLSPGLVLVHRNDAPLFAVGSADYGLGLEAIAEDGNPATLHAAFASPPAGVITATRFDAPTDQTAGPAMAGDVFEVELEADPGDRVSFATMYGASNDWFFASPPNGIDLFLGNDPRWGDITPEIRLYDLGTESDQELDVGLSTGTQQAAADTGSDDGNTLVREVPQNVYDVPEAYHVRVTLTPQQP